MRIAIFGGAFNPVHCEHVNLAIAAVRELKLDKLIIMPTAISPHKGGRLCVDLWQRFEMCRLAFASIPQAEVSNYELSKGGVSYSYLTCRHFADVYPDAERFFVIGADMLRDFPDWVNPRDILKTFKLAACARENGADFNGYKEKVESKLSTKVTVIPYVGEKVSSTTVRTLAALGEDFGAYVSAEVCQYIKSRGLYSLDGLSRVKDMLTPERWAHTVRVALMCAKNASRAGIDEKQAITMAALHDCAKYLPADSPLLCGFQPPDVPPPVLHQFSGAYVAEHTFGLRDATCLDAIRYHTTGRENMTEAGMLLFLCDMLEEGRSFNGVEELRALFKRDLRLCFKEALGQQIDYLKTTGGKIDPLTQKAYDFIKEKVNG